MSQNASGAGGTNPDAATNNLNVTYDAPEPTCGHQVGADLDARGWSTCPGCATLWHPEIVTLDGARARRRLRRAS